ncbi:sigma-70 family RNA polymerase sigma factor [Candidatus Poribacteria bacterium]|nr:sigma-70 family RNA polymerase sigma factor [Candidatus Poribacteria bacterium]
MLKFKAGDVSAFETVMTKHQKSVMNTIFRFIGNREDAEDLTQEVFLRIYTAAKRYRPEAKFTTWLYRIVTNLCLNHRRKAGRFSTTSLDELILLEENDKAQVERSKIPGIGVKDETQLPPDVSIEKQELVASVQAAIHELPENQRLAVIFREYDGLSYQEIAQVMGCSVSAVESLLHRARGNLKAKLAPSLKEGYQ